MYFNYLSAGIVITISKACTDFKDLSRVQLEQSLCMTFRSVDIRLVVRQKQTVQQNFSYWYNKLVIFTTKATYFDI